MIRVYGSSDDLIEIEGNIREEFYSDDEGNLLAFSDGTVLRIIYSDEGVWRISLVTANSDSECSIEPAPEDDEDNYSDVATINNTIKWVVCGNKIAFADVQITRLLY